MSFEDYSEVAADFERGVLMESDVLPDAHEQLKVWIAEAIKFPEDTPTAMSLATSTFKGRPSVRIVLLKGLDESGLYFYTNRESKKGVHLLKNAYAAAAFYWPKLERQVRVEGTVTQVSDAVSDEYFSTRPLNSQLSAWASDQSQVIPSRKYLETVVSDFREEYAEKPMKRPPQWGGYCLQPELIEFWQGRPNRLHDRLQYTLFNGEWKIERLAP